MQDPGENVGSSTPWWSVQRELAYQRILKFWLDNGGDTSVMGYTVYHPSPLQSALVEQLADLGGGPGPTSGGLDPSGIPLACDGTKRDTGQQSVYRSPNGNRFILNLGGTIW